MRTIIFMLLIIQPCLPLSQPVGGAPPETPNAELSLADRVDSVFADWNRRDSPGCAVGVVKNGRWLHKNAFGMANLEHEIPFTTRTVSNIASTSKQFTAMAVLLLAESGKLALDDDIRRYVSELPAYDRPITIRHLLHHTSGLRDYLMLMQFIGVELGRGYMRNDEILALIARQSGLNFEPGTSFEYSNTGYFLLAIVVERVSGMGLAEFAKREIFEPLGMRDTRFQSDVRDIVPRRAQGYGRREDGTLRIRGERTDDIGAGGVLTTLEDLLTWDANFYNPKVGNSLLIRTMLTPGRLANGKSTHYGAGLMLGSYRGLPIVEHPGNTLGHGAEILRFPEQATTVIVLCNGHREIMDPSHLAFDVADIVLEPGFTQPAPEAPRRDERDEPNNAAATVAPDLARGLAGVYTLEHDVIEITAQRGRLSIAVNGNRSRDMFQTDETTFRIAGMPWLVSFPRPNPSPSPTLDFHPSKSSTAITFARAKPVPHSAAAEYTGRYHCDDLNVNYQLVKEEKGLHLQLERYPNRDVFPKPLLQLEPDVFTDANMTYFTFQRSKTGRVTGFRLDDPRAKNLVFHKLDSR